MSQESLVSSDSDGVISDRPIKIGMVAGEVSGDILGSGLIRSLKKRYPNASFEGIGGELMKQEGFHSFVPMERLSVMGLVEVLGRIFELIGIRRKIRKHFLQNRPDVFIGIDAPDFNLGLEGQLRKQGVATTHYVSPSVWAWRQKRVFKIAKAVDLMLTLLPFEAKFYKQHDVRVAFVGHPMADDIPIEPNQALAREKLGLPVEQLVIAILPGSRGGEIKYIGESLITAAVKIQEQRPGALFVVPCVNADRRRQIEVLIEAHAPALNIRLYDGQSRDLMAASNAVMLASGTAALEAMLLKKPMVVAYRVSGITHAIMKRLLKVAYVSLPNLLANKELVPELLQDQAKPEKIASSVLARIDPETVVGLQRSFTELHLSLKQNASETAAGAVAELIESNSHQFGNRDV